MPPRHCWLIPPRHFGLIPPGRVGGLESVPDEDEDCEATAGEVMLDKPEILATT